MIPKVLRETFGIETPGEVFVYEEEGRIIIPPVPSPDELHGIHFGTHERGDVLEWVREMKEGGRKRSGLTGLTGPRTREQRVRNGSATQKTGLRYRLITSRRTPPAAVRSDTPSLRNYIGVILIRYYP